VPGPISLVGAPLVANRRVIGAIAAGRRGDGLFEEDDETAIQLLAAGAASALEAARLQETAAELALIDGLTGLYNRRRLETDLAQAIADCTADSLPVSLAMLDLDHFKELNDRKGHQAGDEVLRRVAGVLRACVRGCDTVYRYGGEEFSVILPGTQLADATAIAERIRASVILDSVSRRPEGKDARPLTVSIGVACLADRSAEGPARLTARADAALYRAKATGRNRVVAAPLDSAAAS
jgi:diguanylate cyclase (GGDEF)-like protein